MTTIEFGDFPSQKAQLRVDFPAGHVDYGGYMKKKQMETEQIMENDGNMETEQKQT